MTTSDLFKDGFHMMMAGLFPTIFHMETMLLYLCGVVEVPKLSFPANKSKWIGHTKAQLKTWKCQMQIQDECVTLFAKVCDELTVI